MFAICGEPTEKGFPILESYFETFDQAEERRKQLRKASKWKYLMFVVSYKEGQLQGGWLVK